MDNVKIMEIGRSRGVDQFKHLSDEDFPLQKGVIKVLIPLVL